MLYTENNNKKFYPCFEITTMEKLSLSVSKFPNV